MVLPGFAVGEVPYAISRVSVDNFGWTSITALIPCNLIVLTNEDPNLGFLFRTVPGNANTQKLIYPGQSQVMGGDKYMRNERGALEYVRYCTGDVVGYIQTVSGVGPIVIECTR